MHLGLVEKELDLKFEVMGSSPRYALRGAELPGTGSRILMN